MNIINTWKSIDGFYCVYDDKNKKVGVFSHIHPSLDERDAIYDKDEILNEVLSKDNDIDVVFISIKCPSCSEHPDLESSMGYIASKFIKENTINTYNLRYKK